MADMPKNPIYVLDLNMKGCKVFGTLNGLPFFEYDAEFGGNYAPPFNTYLIRTNNILDLVVIPSMDNLSKSFEKVDVQGSIKVYESGQISSPEEGNILKEIFFKDFDLTDSTAKVSLKFDNENVDFSELFIRNQKLTDESKIIEYASYLHNLCVDKEVESLFIEYKPKIDDYAIAFFDDKNEYYKDFFEFFNNDFLPFYDDSKFNSEMLILKSYCSNRIWEIKILPDLDFLRTLPRPDGFKTSIAVFVASIDNKIKIIR
jgi:hypothetical protein